ncbi:hypothetical protein RhiirC2_722239 [Rhizophagus irregularis]|uniref:Uncharacterized protein n=1 Tax=Rhizophagus irregularis TaxID=588596 RepID=A0A2N1M2C7_9GLOM|nr:hypothetical protein RhiirC2_722239 [Rhizophagus irregularis]
MMMMHQQRIRGYLKKYPICMRSVYTVIATEIAHLRKNNEFLAGVNAKFSSENDNLKEEIRSSFESLDVIDVPEKRLAKRFKLDGSKKGKKTVHYAENQLKEEQEEQREKEARYDNEVQHFDRMHPEDASQWSYVEQKDFMYDMEIDSRSGFNKDKDYGEEMEEYDDEVQHFDRMHPEDASQWSYVEQEDFIYDMEIDSRSGFNKDEDYDEEMEEVLINSQKSTAGDDLAE